MLAALGKGHGQGGQRDMPADRHARERSIPCGKNTERRWSTAGAAKREGKVGIAKTHQETDKNAKSRGKHDSAKNGQSNMQDVSTVDRPDRREING